MKSYEIVQQLRQTASRKDKEQILLSAFVSGNREFFHGAKLAYDALITFNVKVVCAIAEEDLNPEDPGTFTFKDFLELTRKLRSREITGNAAKLAIQNAASRCHGPTWNDFYRGILRKDLQCGCTDTMINSVLKNINKNGSNPEAEKLIIPVFACQLAKEVRKVPAKKMTGEKLMDIKLDGVRLFTEINKETRTVTQYSRNGLPIDNFSEITKMLEGFLDVFPQSMMLDGEVIGNNFQELMTQINREKDVNTDNAKLALFDIIPLADFKRGECLMPQLDRHLILSELQTSGLLHKFTEGKVFVIPKIKMNLDTEEGQQAFKEFNAQALKLKYEGIMIKDPDAPYLCKRTDAWLKQKPKISVSLVICGFKKGDPNGKNANRVGSILGRSMEGDDVKIETYVSGITDEQAQDFWDRQEELLGMIMEVEADEGFTKNKDSVDTFSLRFPQFKGLRGRTPGELL